MIPGLGLSPAEVQRLKETLCMDHNVLVKVAMLDLNHNHLADVTNKLYDGQVTMSTAGNGATRSSSLTLWDPRDELGLDNDTPNSAAVYYTRMMRVTYCVWRYGDTSSVDIPLFTGPITAVGKDANGMLLLTCMGKETLLDGVVWTAIKWKKGKNFRSALIELMRDRGGETKLDFESSTSKMGSDKSLAREQVIWPAAQGLAGNMRKQLFFDGRGTARLRSTPTVSSFTFRDGPGGSIITAPTWDKDDEALKNRVWLVGAAPKGSKTVPSYAASLPSDHPLNHNRIGRKVGTKTVPRILLEKVEDNEVTKLSVATSNAKKKLDDLDDQQISFRMDVLTMPFLEENDLITVQVQGQYTTTQRVQDATFPFIGPVCSWGNKKNLSLKRQQ